MNEKNLIYNLGVLNHFCINFYATKTSRSVVKDLSNDIYNTFLGYIVSEISMKNQKLLKLIIHCTGAP